VIGKREKCKVELIVVNWYQNRYCIL